MTPHEFAFSLLWFFLAIVSSPTQATLNPDGTKCGNHRCTTVQYCNPFDSQCRPCSAVCDPRSHNHEAELCVRDCQEYLHDQRYILRSDPGQNGDLRAEVQRLKTQFNIALALSSLSIIIILILAGQKLLRCKKIGKTLQSRGWLRKKWIKKATNNNKVQDDAELGNAKQNGLKLTMPTISATVVGPPQSSIGDGTPNTTSTPLSRRHPSEDTTLDYAYDNPAMTPSPEVAQPRAKRESSF